MVKEGIVLGHRISKKEIEVDQAKVEVIEKLSPPISVKGVRSVLGHAACMKVFGELKEKLVFSPIIISPDWSEPFDVMCDAKGVALRVVLRHIRDKILHPIYYASKVLNEAQKNYTVTEQEILTVVFAFEKFCSYLLGTRFMVHTNHSSLRLEDESMRELGEKSEIDDAFSDEHLLAASQDLIPWFVDFANYLSSVDGMIRRCVPEAEMLSVLEACHSSPVGGNHSGIRTAHKILQCGYYWQTIYQDSKNIAKSCDRYQRDGGISKRRELPPNPILACHFPIKLEHKSMWAMKEQKLDWTEAAEQTLNGLNELDKFRLKAYESSAIYKKKMKKYHYQRIEKREFALGDLVLLFNSRLHLFPGKLKSKWTGPFLISKVFPHGVVEFSNKEGPKFTVNGQRIKIYLRHTKSMREMVEAYLLDEV
ncbi:uncharacterized protein LOC107027676 [Solanum pennellii]|uniref:Uncharacterized protein LOC107027676 n=1 Tax=Solanum pennellii TaxID=28526 RepID=A0ABM1HE83_SOLPN|nr:uncharacterized protein LOC107027676 [Solanum pennellii]